MKKPSYMKPGVRSVEGSGVEGSFPKMKEGLGELTPAGFVSYPSGPASVEYAQGATNVPIGAPRRSSATMTPLSAHEDAKEI